MADEYDYLFKSIVVGDGGVGKTAITLRFSKGFFTEDYKMTIGVDFHVKTISIDTEEGPIKVKLQIWDTGGQERFSSIRPMYYRGSLGALLIFDLTFYESFEHLPQWIEEIRANVKSNIPLLLVGNKSDLVDTRAVSIEEINEFTKNFNLYYMETSAKTGEGVVDCFYILACLMVGAGVPDQLVSNAIVFNPGDILTATKAQAVKGPEPTIKVETKHVPKIEPEPEIEFAAPPVPEPSTKAESKHVPKIELESEIIPEIEPEPEIEFAAPPVPEPSTKAEFKHVPKIEPESEIEFATTPIPKPILKVESKSKTTAAPVKKSLEFEFKMPEEILSQEVEEPEIEEPEIEAPKEVFEKKQIFAAIPSISVKTSTPSFKPKTIPFASNIPEPVTPPEEFQPAKIESDSLVDYMPETIMDKKELKKLEKQKKKEEKEKKVEEKKTKAAEIKEAMQKVGKEKEEEKEKIKKEKEKAKKKEEEEIMPTPEIPTETKVPEEAEASSSSLFDTLYQRKPSISTTSAFVPFSPDEKVAAKENPFLKFIPNVAEIGSEQSKDIGKKVKPTFQAQPQPEKKKEIIICNQCGSILSSDYAFCNKCGNKTQ